MNREMIDRIKDAAGDQAVLRDEPMKLHTTFRIGGPADLFVMPADRDSLARVVAICREEQVPWYVIGNGSNLLVSDEGFRGVIIALSRNDNQILVDEADAALEAHAGATLAAVSRRAAALGLTGLEFASGIPGTVGGGVMMNAGAYGGEMKDVTDWCEILEDGQVHRIPGRLMQFGYRTSRVEKEGGIVLGVRLQLKKGSAEQISALMESLRQKRVSKQPLEYPSAGSTFKRPEGYFAGKLIEEAGLKGYRVGDAMVSEKHCGFVINVGEATAADVDRLIRYIQDRVYEQSGVRLETEVRRIGSFEQSAV